MSKIIFAKVFTVDGGLLKIGADVQYRITDPMASFNELQDLNQTLRVTAVAALNTGLAGKKLNEIENEKNYLNAVLQVGILDISSSSSLMLILKFYALHPNYSTRNVPPHRKLLFTELHQKFELFLVYDLLFFGGKTFYRNIPDGITKQKQVDTKKYSETQSYCRFDID